MSTENAIREAEERLHAAISAEARTVGPHELNDDGEPRLNAPIEGAVLEEWVLVMGWRVASGEQTVITRAASKHLPPHHENGLLHEALYNFD